MPRMCGPRCRRCLLACVAAAATFIWVVVLRQPSAAAPQQLPLLPPAGVSAGAGVRRDDGVAQYVWHLLSSLAVESAPPPDARRVVVLGSPAMVRRDLPFYRQAFGELELSLPVRLTPHPWQCTLLVAAAAARLLLTGLSRGESRRFLKCSRWNGGHACFLRAARARGGACARSKLGKHAQFD
jgi:hypothetical protein